MTHLVGSACSLVSASSDGAISLWRAEELAHQAERAGIAVVTSRMLVSGNRVLSVERGCRMWL